MYERIFDITKMISKIDIMIFCNIAPHSEFSRIAAYFIENDAESSYKVTGKRKHSKGPRGGMAIPCKLCWRSSTKRHVKKLDALIAAEKIKILRRYGLGV